MSDDLPQVFPMTQMSQNEEGETVVRRVKPLTYALMAFVKVFLDEDDTMDIADDENSAVWGYSVSVDDDELEAFITTDEEECLISLDIYFGSFDVPKKTLAAINELIVAKNFAIPVGQLQTMYDEGKCLIRYHNAIDVSGIASDDPEYRGPHRIHPELIQNMYQYGQGIVSAVYSDVRDLVDSV